MLIVVTFVFNAGVFIGIGIGFVFILLCILTIFLCKRHFDKNHFQQIANRSHIFAQDEKHELRLLSKGSNNFKVCTEVMMFNER